MSDFWHFLIHTDEYLLELVKQNADLSYLILFLIIFAESGILLFAFLPGDGLLLAVGVIASAGVLNVWLILLLLILAATSGYLLNYFTGRYFGDRVSSGNYWIRQEHMDKTRYFFHRHGAKALIIGRFFPVVRTFAPFMAGMSRMEYNSFFKDNLVGAVIWISIFVLTGYFFGEIPFVQENFVLLYLVLVIISLFPIFWTGFRFLLKSVKPKVKL